MPSDLLDQERKLPEPSKELRKLMDIFSVVPQSKEKFNDDYRPWNNAIIIIVLDLRMNLFKLKERLGKMWGFNDFDFIDLPNNYFVVRFHEDESWGIKYKTIILLEGP